METVALATLALVMSYAWLVYNIFDDISIIVYGENVLICFGLMLDAGLTCDLKGYKAIEFACINIIIELEPNVSVNFLTIYFIKCIPCNVLFGQLHQ